MWVKLYGDNAKGVPAEWPMEVRESGTSPGKDWIEMDKKQYADYRTANISKYQAYEQANPKPVEPPELFTPDQRVEIIRMIKEVNK